ncbi:MAG TPA: tetratricopeptide repeat protein [Blastocatellia bacterium]|nr:tetratricopeptide repeat protein [Blastocatellia bacterium]
MKISKTLYRTAAVTTVMLFIAAVAFASSDKANGKKKFEFTTNSKEAKEAVAQIVYRIETFQFGPEVNAIAKKAVEADPNFAFGYYLVGTTANSPAEAKPSIDKAVELAKQASDGERRYIEAVLLTRANKHDEALAIFNDLAKQYPDERMVQMLLGQVYMAKGQYDLAKAPFERAIQLDGSTPRVYTFLGNLALLKGDYGKARELYKLALTKKAPNTAPFGPGYGMVYAYIYEGDTKSALKALGEYEADYVKAGQDKQFPAVFIWNSIARVHLEYGSPEEAIKDYEKGYSTVPGSSIDEIQKKTWLGRLHHGRGRALAKMGKHEEAWKEAELVKKMIEEGGKEGEQFWPSYHYIAGYLKLEAGDYAKAIEHLKQTDLTDPFHKLLLARAYEKSGDTANAQAIYKEIVGSTQVTIERAIAYPEAKKKLKS